jgi:hypothetical protein
MQLFVKIGRCGMEAVYVNTNFQAADEPSGGAVVKPQKRLICIEISEAVAKKSNNRKGDRSEDCLT